MRSSWSSKQDCTEDIHRKVEMLAADHQELLGRLREVQATVHESLGLLKQAVLEGGQLQGERESERERGQEQKVEKKEIPDTQEVSSQSRASGRWEVVPPSGRNSGAVAAAAHRRTTAFCSDDRAPETMNCVTLPPHWPASVHLREGMHVQSRTAGEVVHHVSRLTVTTGVEHRGHSLWHGPWAPHSSGMIIFDLLGLVVLLYDLLSTPVILAWSVPIAGLLFCGSLASATYWTASIPITFRTGFYRRGELKMEPKDIAWKYLTNNFCFDFALAMVDWISVASEQSGMLEALRSWRVLRFFKVIRAMKFMAICDKLLSYRLKRDRKSIVLIKVGCTTLIFTHMMCCAWYTLGNSGFLREEAHWLDDLDQSDGTNMYLVAYHWVLAQLTLGSNDISPMNSAERAFSIVMNIFGLLYSSTIVAIVSAEAMAHVTVRRERVEGMSRLATFLDQHKINLCLANRVRRQANDRLRTNEVMLSEDDVQALSRLSADVHSDVLTTVRSPHALTHPLFRYWARIDAEATRWLCLEVVGLRTFLPDDCAFMPGVLAKKAFFLTPLHMGSQTKGLMRYTQSCETAFVFQEETTAVRAGAWVAEAALWTEWIHVGKLTSNCTCQLLVVDPLKLQYHLPKRVAESTRKYATEFCLRLRAASPPFASWPNDLHVPGTDPESLLSEQASKGLLMSEWEAGRLQISLKQYAALLEEVAAEKSAVVTVPGQGLQRVVFLAVMQLRRLDGTIFVRVGKWTETEGVMSTCATLPGKKHRRGELPHKALQRLLQSDFAPLSTDINISGSTQEADYWESSKFGLMTKYLRTVHFAEFRAGFEMRELQQAAFLDDEQTAASDCTANNCMAPEVCTGELYVIHTGIGEADLYALIFEDDFEAMCGLEQDDFRLWVRSADPNSCRRISDEGLPEVEMVTAVVESVEVALTPEPVGQSTRKPVCEADTGAGVDSVKW